MAMLDNQQGWVPFERRDCSQGLCTIYCPQWCYVLFPPPPFSITDDDSSSTSFSPLAIAIIGFLATAFLLISYYTVVSKYCGSPFRRRLHQDRPGEERSAEDPHRPESWHLPVSDGLDEALIRKIEICRYKRGEGLGTDCSVCLSEFRENESLRLLPKCSHAFHLHCIDTWLKSHSNCPLCRANIVVQSSDLENSVSPGSDHERQTLVIAVEDPDLVGGGEESEESEEEEEEEEREVGSDGNMVKDLEVMKEIGEENDKLLRRCVSLGSTCQGRVFSISDRLKVNIEDGYMMGGGGGGDGGSTRCGSGQKSKDGRKGRSTGLHRVMSHVRMKRSVSIRRSCFGRQGKEVKVVALSLLGRKAAEA